MGRENPMKVNLFTFNLLLILLFPLVANSITVTDFLGQKVVLDKPAQRIVALAPHIVENIFSAGAGGKIIGVVDYCDYPEAAITIPRLGSMGSFGLEPIVNLQPDLVVIWHSGKGAEMYTKLKELGLTVYASGPQNLEEISKAIRDYGVLAGTEEIANEKAEHFEKKFKQLRDTYQHQRPVRSFYQVWNEPILSINSESFVSGVISLCGGINVFGQSPSIVPKLSIESIIAENPEAIIASGMADERPEWLDTWKEWPNLQAVQKNNLFFVPPDLIQRHSARILLGAEILCEQLEEARTRGDEVP